MKISYKTLQDGTVRARTNLHPIGSFTNICDGKGKTRAEAKTDLMKIYNSLPDWMKESEQK